MFLQIVLGHACSAIVEEFAQNDCVVLERVFAVTNCADTYAGRHCYV